MKLKPTIGMEVHIELRTKTKMFCDSLNNPDEKTPNKNVCPICMGHPGTLPVPNKKAIESVILVGKALNCNISKYSQFDRKNYFYPDLPKGYQISQFYHTLCRDGFIEIGGKKIRITEIHIEEDTGKLTHPKDEGHSLVNYNRAGTPLMELVTEPDFTSGVDARKFCEELQLIVRYLGVSNADMEKGEMRCEVNISLAEEGAKKFGTKTEIKNLNSFKVVEKSVDYEIKRQTEILENEEAVVQETRGWDEKTQSTYSQRKKEAAKDYRYFPEPDIPSMNFSDEFLDSLVLPELPSGRRERLMREYNIPEADVEVLVVARRLGEYFEKVISEIKEWDKAPHQVELKDVEKHTPRLIKLAANYLITELQKLMRESGISDARDIKITPENFAELIVMTHGGEISSSGAQEVLKEMFVTGGDPSNIVEEKGMKQESDQGALKEIAEVIVKNNPQAVEDFKKGKETSVQFLIGQMMRETQGKANPQVSREVLTEILKSL